MVLSKTFNYAEDVNNPYNFENSKNVIFKYVAHDILNNKLNWMLYNKFFQKFKNDEKTSTD